MKIKRLLKTAEASVYLGISPATLKRWVREGWVPIIKLKAGKGSVRFDIRDLNQLIDEHRSSSSKIGIDPGTTFPLTVNA